MSGIKGMPAGPESGFADSVRRRSGSTGSEASPKPNSLSLVDPWTRSTHLRVSAKTFRYPPGQQSGLTFSIFERLRADFRAEMFNAFNRVRFGQGSLTIQSQTFGILSQTAGDQINSPRQMQLALKLYF